MKIDLLCNDGSPLGVTSKTIWGDHKRIGVGGAELALLTMCEEWTKAGHTVTLYNDPWEVNVSPFEQRAIETFDPKEPRDILIIFRSPNHRSHASEGKKIWWSCDQYTIGNFKYFSYSVPAIVCISPFHKQYFMQNYEIPDDKIHVIDLPVRAEDYQVEVARVPNSLLFSSVPDRGLEHLAAAWPLIERDFPDISLVITSDYRLWGVPDARNEQYRARFLRYKNTKFLGGIPRKQLVEEQLKADILAYPSSYDELFCIAVAEAGYAGAYPVTSSVGSLTTTNMGKVVPGHPRDAFYIKRFAEQVVELLSNREELELKRKELMEKSKERFDPKTILSAWDKVFSE